MHMLLLREPAQSSTPMHTPRGTAEYYEGESRWTTMDPWILGLTISRYHEMVDACIHDIT